MLWLPSEMVSASPREDAAWLKLVVRPACVPPMTKLLVTSELVTVTPPAAATAVAVVPKLPLVPVPVLRTEARPAASAKVLEPVAVAPVVKVAVIAAPEPSV